MTKNGGRPVTLKDIARELNLSVNTVSCALKARNGISAETVKKIQDKADELGYIPNSIASAMRTGHTNTIAIILGDISNAYFAIMVKELEREIRAHRCSTIILVTDEDEALETQAIRTAISKNVDGIILFPTCKTMAGINLMRKSGTAFVLLGRRMEDRQTDYIISDDVEGGYLAARYLLEQGHRRILYFRGPEYISCARERYEGFCRALHEKGLEPVKEDVITCDVLAIGETEKKLLKAVEERKDYTAILTFNDLIAFRLVSLMRQRGLEIPEIVGYDNVQSKIDFGFFISSVNIHKALMAQKAVSILFKRIGGTKPNGKFYNEVVPVDLFIQKYNKNGCL